MAFTRDWIVILNGADKIVTFVDKARALTGDFSNPIVRNVGFIGFLVVVPVETLYGTTLPMFLSIESVQGYPRWRVWSHDPATNATTVNLPSVVPDLRFLQAYSAQTPSGPIGGAGQWLTQAWQSDDGRWIFGTGVGTYNDLLPHAYLVSLDAQAGYNPIGMVRFVNVPTIFPAVAVDHTNKAWLTAIETSQSIAPTHVFASTPVTDSGVINMVSVQDAAAAINCPACTPTGNGSGPVPLTIPDYLDAVPDVNDGVWMVGQWVSGGQWWEHITWWH